MKRLLIFALAAIVALLPVSLVRAGLLTVDVPKTMLTVSKMGDIEVKLIEGEEIEFKVDGREYTGMGIEVLVGGMSQMADVTLVSNLESASLPADHDGTLTFKVGMDTLVLEYEGTAAIMHDMVMHTVTIKSHGDFTVTGGTGMFEGLKGIEGGYHMKIVEHGKKVGSMTGFKFSAMEVADVEDVEEVE